MVDEYENENEQDEATEEEEEKDIHLPKALDPLDHQGATFYKKYLAPETSGELIYWIVLLLVTLGVIGFLVVGYSQMGK